MQQAQPRRVSGTLSGELARAWAPGTPPSAARLPHSVLGSRPGSAPAAQGPQTAQQPCHAAPVLHKLADGPGKAVPMPGSWPGSVAAWATQPPAYPTAAAALVRRASKQRALSPAVTPRSHAQAHGAERQVLEPIQAASRQASPGLLPHTASRRSGAMHSHPALHALGGAAPVRASREAAAAGERCQSSRRPGTAPGSMMSSHSAHAEPRDGSHPAVMRRAATAMGMSRDPEHRLRVNRVRRQMLCAGPGQPSAALCSCMHVCC